MLIIWTFIIALSAAHKVFESTEDIGPEAFQNVTTLYPIPYNKTISNIDKNVEANQLSELPEINNNATNNTYSKEEEKPKIDATIWKIEAAFAESNLDDKHEKENSTEDTDKKNKTKEFRPSQHLGNFYDEDNFQVIPTRASFESFIPAKKPSSGFVSSSKDEFRSSFNMIPKQILQTHKQYPYKFESPILTRLKDPWRPDRPDRPDSLESRPTAEVPIKVPAGGFYKYEDPFREKPNYFGKDDDIFKEKPGNNGEDFGLGFTEDEKDGNSAVKKRANPWENFLRLVTAFLPVGLIISALTPSLITVEQTASPGGPHIYPTNLFRRSDPAASALPAITERCRRRLLCELHSDNNYTVHNSPSRRGKRCYKIHCEDTEALANTLRWLLQYRLTHDIQNQNTDGFRIT